MVSFGENHCQLIDINTSEKKTKEIVLVIEEEKSSRR